MKKTNYIQGEIRALSDNVKETRTVEFIISTDKRDRHGTRLMVDRWELDNFNKNGIVGYQHDVYGSFFGEENPDKVIGKGSARIEDNQLIGTVIFEPAEINPLAEKIFQKVLFGSLKSTSVGFRETKEGETIKEEDGTETYVYGGQELLEFSIVNIPSNTDAIKRAEKREELKGVIKEVLTEIETERQTSNTDTTLSEDQIRELNLIINKQKLAL